MDRSGREWMKVVGCGGEWGNVLIWDSLRERDSGAIGVWCSRFGDTMQCEVYGGRKLTGCQDGYSDSVSIVYIGYIHLKQLIQMDGCSVLSPHRDLIHFLLIFKKFF